jgi:hypothetical protein
MEIEKILETGFTNDCFDSKFFKDINSKNVFGEGNGNIFYIKDYQQLCKKAYLEEVLWRKAEFLKSDVKSTFETFLNELIEALVANAEEDRYSGDLLFPGSKFFSLTAKKDFISDLEVNFILVNRRYSFEWPKYNYDLVIIYKDYKIFRGSVIIDTEHFYPRETIIKLLGVESVNCAERSFYRIIISDASTKPEANLKNLYHELKRYQQRVNKDG